VNSAITIFDSEGEEVQTFPVPGNRLSGRHLWCFLVGNLQEGFVVRLAEGNARIILPSGSKVSTAFFEKLNTVDDLNDLDLN
jgi:hypothetical protein